MGRIPAAASPRHPQPQACPGEAVVNTVGWWVGVGVWWLGGKAVGVGISIGKEGGGGRYWGRVW